MVEKAHQLFTRGIVGAVCAVGDLVLDAAGADGALAAIAAQSAIETCTAIADDGGEWHIRRVELLPPLGQDTFLGGMIIGLRGKVRLAFSAI